jgi:hypothetical protein
MSAREDIGALLADAQEQIDGTLPDLHHKSLTDPNARPRFRARVKSVLEQQRSILDYLAVDITTRLGTPSGFIYYPLAQNEASFNAEIDNKMCQWPSKSTHWWPREVPTPRAFFSSLVSSRHLLFAHAAQSAIATSRTLQRDVFGDACPSSSERGHPA